MMTTLQSWSTTDSITTAIATLAATDFNSQVQSCVAKEISAVDCMPYDPGCFCEKPAWVSHIASCATLEQNGTTNGVDLSTLSFAYCHDKTDEFTESSTDTGEPVFIVVSVSTVTPFTTSTIFVTPAPGSATPTLSSAFPTNTNSADDSSRTQLTKLPRTSIIGLAIGIPLSLLSAAALTALLCLRQQGRKRHLEECSRSAEKRHCKANILWSWAQGRRSVNDHIAEHGPNTVQNMNVAYEIDNSGAEQCELWTTANVAEMDEQKKLSELALPEPVELMAPDRNSTSTTERV